MLPPPLPRLVREFVAQNNTSQIKHVIQILSQEFALSQHPHSRKGGLIGLAACSIALGKVGVVGFLACAGCGERTAAPPARSRAGGPTAPRLPPCIVTHNCLVLEFSQHTQPHPLGPGALSGLGFILEAAQAWLKGFCPSSVSSSRTRLSWLGANLC